MWTSWVEGSRACGVREGRRDRGRGMGKDRTNDRSSLLPPPSLLFLPFNQPSFLNTRVLPSHLASPLERRGRQGKGGEDPCPVAAACPPPLLSKVLLCRSVCCLSLFLSFVLFFFSSFLPFFSCALARAGGFAAQTKEARRRRRKISKWVQKGQKTPLFAVFMEPLTHANVLYSGPSSTY